MSHTIVSIARESNSLPDEVQRRHRVIHQRRVDNLLWRFKVVVVKLPLIVASICVLATTTGNLDNGVCSFTGLGLWNWLLVRLCWTVGVDVLWQGWERWLLYRRELNNQRPHKTWLGEQWDRIRNVFPFVWMVIGFHWYVELQQVSDCDSSLLKMVLAYCVLDVLAMIAGLLLLCCCLPCVVVLVLALDRPRNATPLTEADIARTLKNEAFKPIKGAGEIACAICVEDIAEGETVNILPDCGHVFHSQCLSPWLQLHPTCPNCRKKVTCSVAESRDNDNETIRMGEVC
jgi:hypothetical protein